MASIADLISNLKKKLKDGYNGVADALPIVPNTSQIKSFASNPVQFVSNPSYNGGNNLYRTTPFKIGAQVQNFIESPKRTYDLIPEIKVDMGAKTPTANMVQGATNFALNLPINMAKYIGSNVIDTATDAGANIGRTITGRPLMGYEQVKSPVTRLGYQAAQGLLKLKAPTDTKLNAKEVIGNLGEEANVLLDASTGNFAKNLAQNAVKEGSKRVMLNAIKKGAIEGGTMGGLMGFTQGLGDNRKTKNNLEYARNVLTTLGQGALAGSAFGGATGGASALWTKLNTRVKKVNPKLTEQEAKAATNDFIRNELGQFIGRGKKQVEDATEWIIAKDKNPLRNPYLTEAQKRELRRSLLLPEDGNYQGGYIKLDEPIVGTGKTQGLPKSTVDPIESPKVMNITQYTESVGAGDNFGDILAANDPNSNRYGEAARRKLNDRIYSKQDKYYSAREDYRRLVKEGKIVDPSGEFTAEKLLKQEADIANEKLQQKITQIQSQIDLIESMGTVSHGKNGLLRPKYQRTVDTYKSQLREIQSQASTPPGRIQNPLIEEAKKYKSAEVIPFKKIQEDVSNKIKSGRNVGTQEGFTYIRVDEFMKRLEKSLEKAESDVYRLEKLSELPQYKNDYAQAVEKLSNTKAKFNQAMSEHNNYLASIGEKPRWNVQQSQSSDLWNQANKGNVTNNNYIPDKIYANRAYSNYKGSRFIKGKYNGRDYVSDGFIMEYDSNVKAPTKAEVVDNPMRTPSEDMIRKFYEGNFTQVEPQKVLKGDSLTYVRLGDSEYVNKKYFDYFLSKYKDAKFLVNSRIKNAPIMVKSGETDIGFLMPIRALDNIEAKNSLVWERKSSSPTSPSGRNQNAVTPQEKLILKQPREEKIAMGMLKKGEITPRQYNEIAVKNEGKIKPISNSNILAETQKPKGLEPANTSSLTSSLHQKPQGQGQQLQIGEQTNQTGGMGQLPPVPPKQTGFGDSQQKSSGGSVSDFIGQVKSNLNKFYTKTVDRFHPISMLAKEAGQEQATRNAMTGYYGAGSKAEYHVDYELTPILKEHNLDDLRNAAIAFRDIELSNRGIQGSNKGDPQAILKDMEARLGANKVKQIGETLKKLYAYQDKMVKEYLVNTGVINKQNYENMRQNNQFYVPFKRVMDQVDEFLGVVPQTKNAGSVNYQDVIKGIKGSAREIVDPIESIIEASYKMVNVGQRQKVAQQIVKLGKTSPGMITKEIGDVGNKPHISLFENGRVVNYLVPEDIAIAAKGLTDDGVNTLVKILQAPTRVFRASATGLNPEFFVPNVARDLQSAWVNYGLNPLDWVSGLAHYVKKDDMYKEFLKSGGKTSFVAIDKPQIRKNVQDIGGIGSKGIAVFHPRELLKYVQNLSEASEMGTRVSLFEKLFNKGIKEGLDRNEAAMRAAYAAQEGTVNFARRGADTKSINAIYAFLNARVQGIDRLIRSVKNDPKGAGTRLGFMIATPALGLYAWNRNFDSYDDERVVSKSDKQNNFIIMLSDKPIQSLGGAQYLKIPKAEVGKLANPIESFLSFLDGKDSDSKEALLMALKGFSPVDNIGDLIPTALRPPVEVAANKSFFFNTDIVPDYKTNYPAKYQYSSYTAPIYKMIGDKLNISPAKIQAIVEGYATGWAKIGETSTRPFVPEQYKSEKDNQGQPINRTPIIRRVLGGERRTAGEQDAIDEKKAKSIDFQINDIKSGVNRGDLPMDEGVKEIQKLRLEQQKIQNSGSQSKGVFYFKDEEGKLKEIDITKPLVQPTLTGNTELDKKLISKYNGAITRRANDIEALYSAGQIKADEAEKMLSELMTKKISTNKGKTIKIGKVPKIKTPKVKLAKVKSPKIKIPKLKLARAKAVKLKLTKPKNTKIKLAMGGSKA